MECRGTSAAPPPTIRRSVLQRHSDTGNKAVALWGINRIGCSGLLLCPLARGTNVKSLSESVFGLRSLLESASVSGTVSVLRSWSESAMRYALVSSWRGGADGCTRRCTTRSPRRGPGCGARRGTARSTSWRTGGRRCACRGAGRGSSWGSRLGASHIIWAPCASIP